MRRGQAAALENAGAVSRESGCCGTDAIALPHPCVSRYAAGVPHAVQKFVSGLSCFPHAVQNAVGSTRALP